MTGWMILALMNAGGAGILLTMGCQDVARGHLGLAAIDLCLAGFVAVAAYYGTAQEFREKRAQDFVRSRAPQDTDWNF